MKLTRTFPIARAVSCALLALAASTVQPAAAAELDAVRQESYSISAGRLSDVLARFAAQSGVALSFDPQLLGELTSAGLEGNYTVRAGFDRLLEGSGFILQERGADAWTLQRIGAIRTLASVRVEETMSPLDDPGATEGTGLYAARTSSTAFKLPLTLREIPQTVTVIPSAVIQDFALNDLRSIIQFTPGVYVTSERSTQAYYFLARGYELQTQYDGLPSPTKMGARGVTGLDPAVIDRVEVLHGASGLLSGPGAPGGTVNVMRKMPTRDAKIGLELGIDEWGGVRGLADVSGPLGDNGYAGRLVGVIERRDSFIDDVDATQSVVYGVLQKDIGERTALIAGINLEQIQDASYGAHYGLPTQLDGTPLPLSRTKNYGATWSRQDDLEQTVFLRAQHVFLNDWQFKAQLTYERFDTRALESVPGRTRDPDTVQNIYLFTQLEQW
ncbi:MAG: TonB-dependent receptor plug domain-containing protein, partial [Steroidobacteraceae bacterium]